MSMPGAPKPSQAVVAGDEAHRIAEKVRGDVEQQAGKKSVWEPVEYSTQVRYLCCAHNTVYVIAHRGLQAED